MTLTDDTATLPVLRPAAPLDEALTGPPWWLALVAYVARYTYRPRHWHGMPLESEDRSAARARGVLCESTGEWPVLGGVT